MKSKVASTLLALAAATAVATSGAASARDLMIVGFGGGFQDNARKHLFQGYEKATGVAVKDDVYNGEMAKVYSMVKAKDVTYDVIMVEAPELVRGCEDGIFEKMDWSVVKKDKFIPNGTSACGAGAVLWGVSLFYDQTKIKNGPTTYGELWDLAKFPGKRSLRFTPKTTLEIALIADGVAARGRVQGARHARGPAARVRLARQDQAAASCGGSRARSRCSSWAAARSPTPSASPDASCAPMPKAATSIRCCGRRSSTRWTRGPSSRARRMRRKASR